MSNIGPEVNLAPEQDDARTEVGGGHDGEGGEEQGPPGDPGHEDRGEAGGGQQSGREQTYLKSPLSLSLSVSVLLN